MAGLQAVGSADAKEKTLTERLNDVSTGLSYQFARLESVLSRVNSTPQNDAKSGAPAPSFGTAEIVTKLEEQCKRLGELCNSMERIA